MAAPQAQGRLERPRASDQAQQRGVSPRLASLLMRPFRTEKKLKGMGSGDRYARRGGDEAHGQWFRVDRHSGYKMLEGEREKLLQMN